MLAFEMGAHMTFLRRKLPTLPTCPEKATPARPSALDSQPLTTTQPLLFATPLESCTVLTPCLLVKGKPAFTFIQNKKQETGVEVVRYTHFLPQKELVHIELTQGS